uniref:Zinc transporter ZIP4/12 EF-hand domain-containing protein n=1 Tax=Neogobius melanostomus TaxID=47308 RepID=A0A8C6S4W3_9GOBI
MQESLGYLVWESLCDFKSICPSAFLSVLQLRGDSEVYRELVSLVNPGQQHLTGTALRSGFNTLEKRVQCAEVPCEKSCVDAAELTEGQEDGEVGGVLGQVLLHALKGHCFMSQTLPEESFFLDDIMERLGSDNFTVEGNCYSDNDHGHDHSHSEHGHNRHNHRRKRSAHEHWEEHRENSTWDEHCFSAEELMRIFHSNSSSSDARSHLARLSPALVQQLLSGACTRTTNPVNPGDRLSKTERYLYATLANVVITVLSMFGLVLLLCTSCTTVFQLCIQFCISLAVGSLTGDALLHLLPMFLGLHVHAEEGSSDHVHSDGPPDYVLKMLVVIAGIYCFYLMESLFSLISHKKHQHSHHHDESEPHHCDHGKVLEMYQQEKKQKKQKEKMQSVSKADLRLLPYMITIGDGLHNFADGLAMGAAFSVSWRSGLATSIAVLCHEIPHELGDFAILLHSGVSVRRALLLNVGSALTSFIGLYIALSIATDIATQQWIAAIATGLFLYVGLADMLPTLVHFDSRRPWTVFLLQNIGLLSGWGILLLLSLYEEKINF